ncbi:hypothetical protein BOTBODRAFT_66951 [Botryobasidium botryosum FD-172 SS1]|uniref:OPT family small oligopeptide transporter n=1 Tax=Botryobasidium botryosum (strain FD-172 SS1) TaxID=930990 RepID=A0A067MBU9_BOTB1|nr:hypothetical protein BOTBODRAFT_66951 [Botryobasidium botryosum FD-172 SS1]
MRPSTSQGARPSTAAGRPPTAADDTAQHHPAAAAFDDDDEPTFGFSAPDYPPHASDFQYPYLPNYAAPPALPHHQYYDASQVPEPVFEEDEEEEEESEDEDVFAYLPPTTADQQATNHAHQMAVASAQQAYAQQQQQHLQQPPYPHPHQHPQLALQTSDLAPYPPYLQSNPNSASLPASTYATPISPLHPASNLSSTFGKTQHALPHPASPPDSVSGAGDIFVSAASSGSPGGEAYSMRAMGNSNFDAGGMGGMGGVGVTAPGAVYNPHLHQYYQPTSLLSPQHSLAQMQMQTQSGPASPVVLGGTDNVPLQGGAHGLTTDGNSSREIHVRLPSRDGRGMAKGEGDVGEGAKRAEAIKRVSGSSAAGSEADDIAGEVSIKDPFPPHVAYPYDFVDDEDSPYPEVRASVSNIDDPEMPVSTFRMWFIGLVLCILASGMNMFFTFRYPAPSVVPMVLLLVAHPIGKFMAFSLPIRTWRLPRWLGGYEFSLNPGPFNIKEHVLIFIMANVATPSSYAINTLVVSRLFYDVRQGVGFSITLVLATQLTGFGLAGTCRRFLVWPASMIWPQNLVACTLLNTLHAEDDDEDVTGGSGGGKRGITRYKFFVVVGLAAFFWNFLPSFLFQALSTFSWICWFTPDNVVVNQLFGSASGLGMGILTFDWNQIEFIGSPLMVPWWAEVHIFLGFVLFYWILCPILYYTNVWELGYLPLAAPYPYDKFGDLYDTTRVMTPDRQFNLTGYNEYSPMYLTSTYVITYLLAFMLSTAVLVHTALYHGRALINGVKRIKIEEDDIHAKLMRNYPEVPDWWYLSFLVVFFCLGIVAIRVWDTGMPVWTLLIALLIPFLYLIPTSFIFAVTGQAVAINLIAEIIPGTIMPGKPLGNMIFKGYAIQTTATAISFVQDLKLGHYIKVPPRATFVAQAVATILASLTQVGVEEFLFANVPDICDIHQKNHLTCPHSNVYFTASVVWGLIGPKRLFGRGATYHVHLYALLIGALLPVPFWLWQRRYPKTWLKHVNIPVLLNGPTFLPPATGINYSSWFVVAFIFQYLIRRRNFRWWSKFNYIMSAALDIGTVMSVIVIFLVLQLPDNGNLNVNWWGNNVFQNTGIASGIAWLTVTNERCAGYRCPTTGT